MPYTTHGHALPGTTPGEPKPQMVARCGGPELCAACSREAALRAQGSPMTADDMAEGQRTAFGLARAMGSGDTQAVGAVLADMTTIHEIRRALMASAAMCAWIVREAGMDWAALSEEIERRLSR